jgi:hypothetical protein
MGVAVVRTSGSGTCGGEGDQHAKQESAKATHAITSGDGSAESRGIGLAAGLKMCGSAFGRKSNRTSFGFKQVVPAGDTFLKRVFA